jgi:tetratricopeptide (TPR) repeat protein
MPELPKTSMWILILAAACLAEDADRIIADAEILIGRGQADRAVDLLRGRLSQPGLAEGPGTAALWGNLGRAARAAWDFETAAEAYDAAFRRGAGLPAAVAAVECRLEMKDAGAAQEVLGRCGNPQAPEIQALLAELSGMALFLQSKEEEARSLLEKALAGGRPGAAHYLGLIRFHRGEYREALAYLEKAIQADPEDYYSLLYRAWALMELNRLDEARKAFDAVRAVAATPETDDMMGRLELRAERFEEALQRFRAALAANPAYAESQSGLATALRRLGRAQEAREATAAFRKLFQLQQENLRIAYTLHQKHLADPRNAGVAEELARHYLDTGDLQEAERLAWKALALEPGRIPARLILARSLSRIGRYQEAAVHFRRILRQKPDHAEARAELEDLIRSHARRRPADG